VLCRRRFGRSIGRVSLGRSTLPPETAYGAIAITCPELAGDQWAWLRKEYRYIELHRKRVVEDVHLLKERELVQVPELRV